jgi:hypothetical protein
MGGVVVRLKIPNPSVNKYTRKLQSFYFILQQKTTKADLNRVLLQARMLQEKGVMMLEQEFEQDEMLQVAKQHYLSKTNTTSKSMKRVCKLN